MALARPPTPLTSVKAVSLTTRLLDTSQNAIRPFGPNDSTPSFPPSFVVSVMPPAPDTTTGNSTVMERCESSVSLWVLVQPNDALTKMSLTLAPVATVTSEAASMFARSVAFSVAICAVGVQYAAVHDTLMVGFVEMKNEACAGTAAHASRAIDTKVGRPHRDLSFVRRMDFVL